MGDPSVRVAKQDVDTRPDRYERVLRTMLGNAAASPENNYLIRYFRELVAYYGRPRRPVSVVVTHLLPERPVLLRQ